MRLLCLLGLFLLTANEALARGGQSFPCGASCRHSGHLLLTGLVLLVAFFVFAGSIVVLIFQAKEGNTKDIGGTFGFAGVSGAVFAWIIFTVGSEAVFATVFIMLGL